MIKTASNKLIREGQYVAEVEKNLVEVEVELQKRALDAARAEVTQAIKGLEKAQTNETVAEARTAILALEKTLETVHQKDPALAPTFRQI